MPPDAAEIAPTPIAGGLRVKTTATHHIDMLRMLFNWRICTTPIGEPNCYDRHWCYKGTGLDTFMAAVLAAHAWDGAEGTEPDGWNKNGQTHEWRE